MSGHDSRFLALRMRRQVLLLAALVGQASILGCRIGEPYLDWSHYSGDAEVWEDKDPGLGTPDDIYPRYFMVFPGFNVGESPVHEFAARGIPYYEYWFAIAVDNDAGWRTVLDSGLRCYVDIEELESGKVIHLGGEMNRGDTIKGLGWISYAQWYKKTRHVVFVPAQLSISRLFRPDPFRRYVIRIRTELPDNQAKPSNKDLPSLTPILWAGSGVG